MEGTFQEWLEQRVSEQPSPGKVSRRELARRLADLHPDNGDPDHHRRSLRRILKGERVPRQPYRDSIQDALDDHTAPTHEDEIASEAMVRERLIEQHMEAIRRIALGVRV
jgi:hypothetical protein